MIPGTDHEQDRRPAEDAGGSPEPQARAADDAVSDSDEPTRAARSDGGPPDVAELEREIADVRAKWQRAQADYQNLKRRSLVELEGALRRSMQPLLDSLLLVLDHLDMALKAPCQSAESEALAAGVRMTRDQLVRALEDEDVRPVPEEGAFDPEVHQAVATVEDSGAEPGAIVDVVRRGYRWRGQVLRPAQVRVAAVPEPPPGES